jgi:HEPN domain-containing protein
MLSDYDLETVDVLINGKRWVYVAYICQQAVERQLKGMYVLYIGKEAPKTHNLNFLFARICECEPFRDCTPESELGSQINKCEDFLIDIMYYYMSDYPFSYKNIMSRFISEEKALELFNGTKKCVSFLRGLCESHTVTENE